jgi:hypothetical protein
MSNVARNSAAQSLMNHAREMRSNHLSGIDTVRNLGQEETARTQAKMDAKNQQRMNAAAQSRNLPAQILSMTNEAPYPGLPYEREAQYVAPPLRSAAGERYAYNRMHPRTNQQGGIAGSFLNSLNHPNPNGGGIPTQGVGAGASMVGTSVDPMREVLRNVMGTR